MEAGIYMKSIMRSGLFNNVSGGVWGVSIASMLIAISTSMVFSISPIYVTKVLGLSVASMGLIEGFSEGLAQFSKLASGYSGDFFKRKKPPLLIGAILATLSKPIFILAGSVSFLSGLTMVVTSKCIERVSNGIMATPRDAYISEASDDKTRGNALGLMMSLKTFGCVIGSFFIGALTEVTSNYQLLLWFGFLPCVLSILVLMRYMKEKPLLTKDTDNKARTKNNHISWNDLKKLNGRYWSLILVATLFMSARFSDGFLIIRLDSLGAPMWISASVIGLFNLISALSCLPIGRLSDRIDRSKILYFSFATLVLSNICFLSDDLSLAMIGVLMWGAQRGTSQVLFSAIIGDEAPRKIIGTAMGIFYLLTGVMAVFSGMVAGHLGDISIKYIFMFGFSMSFIALTCLVIRNFYYKHKAPFNYAS